MDEKARLSKTGFRAEALGLGVKGWMARRLLSNEGLNAHYFEPLWKFLCALASLRELFWTFACADGTHVPFAGYCRMAEVLLAQDVL